MPEVRELPAAVETEKKLLGSIMLTHGESLAEISKILGADDFSREDHRIIFNTAVYTYTNRKFLDKTLIAEDIKKYDKRGLVDQDYLYSLFRYEFTGANIEEYAKTVKQKANLRNIIRVCEEVMDFAYDQSNEYPAVLDFANQHFFEVTEKTAPNTGPEHLYSIVQRSFQTIQYLQNHPEEVNGVPTGLKDLDKVINGLHKSDLILLAARPSMGKTALALNIAYNATKAKKKVILFSLEMNKEQIGNRFLSLFSGVNSMYLTMANLSNDNMGSLVDAMESTQIVDIYVEDTSNISILDVRATLQRVSRNQDIDLLIIDYLQLMKGSRSRYSEQNRQQEISEISRTLKALAREFNIPVLALSQLSRNVEMRAEKKPQLSDLRESGALEQDADLVMFLYRDEYYNRDDSENENIAELLISKNRNGPTTSIRLQFQKEIMRFGDLTRAEM